jgi:hypothetical protein
MARVVVAGYAVRFPLAGNVWAHIQYVVGLARLGHDVWFLEEAGGEGSCYDPATDSMGSDPAPGLAVVGRLMDELGLAERWAFLDSGGRWHGLDADTVDELIAGADLFLDVGGASHFPQMRFARRRAHVDMDPVFTQLGAFGADRRLGDYDTLFTYGTSIGRRGCAVPTGGFDWHATYPPAVLDLWHGADEPGDRWTTVAQWFSYGALERDGEVYGQKDIEFMRIADLPRLTEERLEIAVGEEAPRDDLRARGWSIVDPVPISADPWRYREYVWGSRGELSVAKNAYVKTNCGWFSDRTATYLASGRPAVVQDTGLEGALARGEGLLTFTTVDEAAAALATVNADYERHSRAARALAEAHLDSDRVLTHLLEDAGV